MIDREDLWQALHAWLQPSHKRGSNLPMEAVRVRAAQHPALPSRWQGPDPWAAAQQELDRKLAEFEALEKRMAQAARRDGIDEDGPMVPTLQALRLCMDSLRDMTGVVAQIPTHYVGQILDALSASRTVTQAETDRFRAEIEHTETNIVRRVAQSIAEGADKALARRVRVFDRNTAFAAAVILVMTAGGCLGIGYRWGSSNARADIQQTEWRLRAAFAHGGLGASLWALLMEANDIETAIKQCHGANLIPTGTRQSACMVPLWTSLADESPPQAQPSSEEGFLTVTPVVPAASPTATARAEPQTPTLFALPRPPAGPIHFGSNTGR